MRYQVDRTDGKVVRIVRSERAFEKVRKGNLEFLGIEPELRVIGISGGIIRSRDAVVSSGKVRLHPVHVHEGSGQCGIFVMHDVVPRRISGNRGLRRNRRHDRSDVRLDGRVLGVRRIPRKREEPDSRQYRENRNDHDEFNERESPEFGRPLPDARQDF